MTKIHPVVMPKWGLAMTEGTVVAWHAGAGAEIAVGDDLLDIETTKITNVVESAHAGVLRRHAAAEGAALPVGALLAVIAGPEVPDPDIDAFIAEFDAKFAVVAAAAEASAPEPQSVEAARWRFNYLDMGEREGPPLVLIHGFGGDLNNWMFNQPTLAERHRVIALDLPGHGRSAKDVGAGDLAALTAALAAFLDALSIERAHLTGHSMGGALALAFALERPERVASLSLIAPGGLGSQINMDFIDGYIGAGRRKVMKGVLQLLVADPALISRDMIEDVLKFKRLDGVDSALRRLAGTLFPDGRQRTFPAGPLQGLSVPAQAIWGKDDKILPASQARALPQGVTVHLLDRTGHMPHMEKAGEVNALIEELIAR